MARNETANFKLAYNLLVSSSIKCAVLSALLSSSTGWAQNIPGLPPEPASQYSMVDGAGVNLSTGALTISNNDISVGIGEFPSKIDFVRTYSLVGLPASDYIANNEYVSLGNGGQNNLLVYFACELCKSVNGVRRMVNVTIAVFGKAYHFTDSGPSWSSSSLTTADEEGATMTIVDRTAANWTYQLITHDGVKVLFSDNSPYIFDKTGGRYAEYAEFPNGDFLIFGYESSPNESGVTRLKSVTNSRGYGLTFNYFSGVANYSDGPDVVSGSLFTSDRSIISGIQANRVSCSSSSTVNCSVGTLASVSYGYSSSYVYLTSFTGADTSVTNYHYDSSGRLIEIIKPTSPTVPALKMTYLSGVSDDVATTNWLSSVAFAGNGYGFSFSPNGPSEFSYSLLTSITDHSGNVTSYNFTPPDGEIRSVTVTDPNGQTDTYITGDLCLGEPCLPYAYLNYSPTQHVDSLLRTTSYTHDLHGRPVSVTYPEGNGISQTYDSAGNITEMRYIAKPGSGSPDHVITASYPACNSANYKYCTKPSYVIDARGSRWDYQYDTNSGEVAVALAPADSSNVRAVTRNTFGAFSYASSISVPFGVSPPQAYYITAKDTCLSSPVTGTTVDFTYVCPAGSRRRDVFNYVASTDSARTSHELASVVADADNVSAVTAYTYDQVGNIISIKEPRTDIDQTQYTTYDLKRRKVFEIGFDPDGSGSLPRQIVHHVYDTDDNEIRKELGTGTALDGSDFAILKFKRMTYEPSTARLLKTEEVVP